MVCLDIFQMDYLNNNNSDNNGFYSLSSVSNVQLPGADKYHRMQQFNRILEYLTIASNASDHEEQITSIITRVFIVLFYAEHVFKY